MRVGFGSLMAAALALASPAMADDGCAPGFFTVTPATTTSGSIFFDDFISEAGGFTGVVVDSSICSLMVPVADDGYSAYGLDYRGFVGASEGQTATVIGPDGTTVIVIKGPNADTYTASKTVGAGPGGQLDVSSELTVDAGTNPDDIQGTVNSIDYARVGFVTVASMQGSVNQIADQRSTVTPQLQSTANLLLGFLQPVDRPTGIGAVAAVGSYLVGAEGAYVAMPDLTLTGGVAAFQQTNAGVGSSGLLVAGSARYLYEVTPTFNLFGEAGVWGVPNLGLSFSRQYVNNGATVTAASQTTGALASVYGRGGVVFSPNPMHQFELSATVGTTWLTTDAFTEAAAGNLFAASFPKTTTQSPLVKGTASWTGEFAHGLDVTLSAALGQTFGADPVVANIAFAGPLSAPMSSRTFVEYGARVGWQFTPNAKASAFVAGTTGTGIGTETRVGGMLAVAF